MNRIIVSTAILAFSLVSSLASAQELATSASGVLTLPEAIELALKTSPQLESANAAVDAATGAQEQAGAWLNPEVGVDMENIGGSNTYSGFNSAEITYGVSQRLEIGGKRNARTLAAQAAKEAAIDQNSSMRASITRDATVAYMEAVAAIKKQQLAAEQKRLASIVAANVTKRVNAAREPKIQESKAEVSLATATVALAKAEREAVRALAVLSMLVGTEITADKINTEAFETINPPQPLEAYKELLARNPNLRILQSKIKEQEAALSFEKASVIPDPTINAGVRDYRDTGDHAFVVGVSLPIPVFDQNSGGIRKAHANINQARSDALQGQRTLQQELLGFWQQWNSAHQEASALKQEILPEAEEAFALSRKGYRMGKFPYLDVLDAQRTLFEAKAQYFEALLSAHTAQAEVERLTTANVVEK